MTFDELKSLRIKQISWKKSSFPITTSINFSLSDGTFCSFVKQKMNASYKFEDHDIITKVEVFYDDNPETLYIEGIRFYHDNKMLVSTCKNHSQRPCHTKTFLIGANERLIGCELDIGSDDFLYGITFINWTIP